MEIALNLEKIEKQSRAGMVTTVHLQKILNEVAERETGESINLPSVEKYLTDWHEGITVNKSAGTAERYGHTKRSFLTFLEEKAKKPISILTPQHIEGFLTWRLQSNCAPKTVIVDVKTLSIAFNRAEKFGMILKNPVGAVQLPKNVSSVRQVFSHEQVEMLLGSAASTDLRTLILLGYYTGARLSDCVQMKWKNVNIGDGVLFYVQQKTDKTIKVSLHIELLEHLSALYDEEQMKEEDCICRSLVNKGSGGKSGLCPYERTRL